jgi:murein DD-endopeptidase MepM/ murein hydrolase activator NlpD
MRKIFLIIAITFVAASTVTVFAYNPISLLVYRIREPYFKRPLDLGAGKIVVRNDGHGDGEFGAKRRNGRSHTGIDMLAPAGTPVYAAKSGLAFTGEVPTRYGKYVMIYHPDGFQTYYGHLSSWAIRSPKYVRQGELIGCTGTTGNAASKAIQPHLHFEIRKDGEPQTPRYLMK